MTTTNTSSPKPSSAGYGAALRSMAPQAILQVGFMLVYSIWWVFAWPLWGSVAFSLTAVWAAIAVFLSIRNIRHSRQFEALPSEEGDRIGKQMGILSSVSYGLLWLAVAVLALTGLAHWILPVAALIIGLHFFPLAKIFNRKIDFFLAPVAVLFAGIGLWMAAQPDTPWQLIFGVSSIGGALATLGYSIYLLSAYRRMSTAVVAD